MSLMPTDTGYPTGLSRIHPEHRESFMVVQQCGGNLDAPEWIVTGGVFWGPLTRATIVGAWPRRHLDAK